MLQAINHSDVFEVTIRGFFGRDDVAFLIMGVAIGEHMITAVQNQL